MSARCYYFTLGVTFREYCLRGRKSNGRVRFGVYVRTIILLSPSTHLLIRIRIRNIDVSAQFIILHGSPGIVFYLIINRYKPLSVHPNLNIHNYSEYRNTACAQQMSRMRGPVPLPLTVVSY